MSSIIGMYTRASFGSAGVEWLWWGFNTLTTISNIEKVVNFPRTPSILSYSLWKTFLHVLSLSIVHSTNQKWRPLMWISTAIPSCSVPLVFTSPNTINWPKLMQKQSQSLSNPAKRADGVPGSSPSSTPSSQHCLLWSTRWSHSDALHLAQP